MGMAAVFIDGAYFEKMLRHDHASARIDSGRLVGIMVGESDELRAYCLPLPALHVRMPAVMLWRRWPSSLPTWGGSRPT